MRASAPVVGVVMLVLATAITAGIVTAGLSGVAPASPPPQAAFSLAVDGDTNRITIRHLGGDAIDVRELSLHVQVNGTPLSQQPPVPFFAAAGFRAGPTGPFNSAADPRWQPGESASVRVASTNTPEIGIGSSVVVRLVIEGIVVARLRATAA